MIITCINEKDVKVELGNEVAYDSRQVVPDHFQSNTMLLYKVGHDEVPPSGMPPKQQTC